MLRLLLHLLQFFKILRHESGMREVLLDAIQIAIGVEDVVMMLRQSVELGGQAHITKNVGV